jgi:dihydrofolate reductase
MQDSDTGLKYQLLLNTTVITINLIWAQSKNGIIGHHGTMPWHLPEDLVHFKNLTTNHPVIMGRKTWDSLPDKSRPLPNRKNIVLTRQKNWGDAFDKSNVIKSNTIDAAITPQILGAGAKHVWVIGGGEIYKQFLPRAYRIEITEIQHDFQGDTSAPILGPNWIECNRISNLSKSGLKFDFVTFINKDMPGQSSFIY